MRRKPRITGPYARSAKVKPDSSGLVPGMTEERKKRRGPPARRAIRKKRCGSRARPCGGHHHACDRHRHRPLRHPERAADGAPGDRGVPRRAPPRNADPRIEYADSPVPRAHGRHLPTAMSTGGSSRQRSTFPPGIRRTRMPTRSRFVYPMPVSTARERRLRLGVGRRAAPASAIGGKCGPGGFSRARLAGDRGARAAPWRRADWRRHSSKCSRAGRCRRRRCRAIHGTGTPAGCP